MNGARPGSKPSRSEPSRAAGTFNRWITASNVRNAATRPVTSQPATTAGRRRPAGRVAGRVVLAAVVTVYSLSMGVAAATDRRTGQNSSRPATRERLDGWRCGTLRPAGPASGVEGALGALETDLDQGLDGVGGAHDLSAERLALPSGEAAEEVVRRVLATRRSADPHPHPVEVPGADRAADRPQPVVAVV